MVTARIPVSRYGFVCLLVLAALAVAACTGAGSSLATSTTTAPADTNPAASASSGSPLPSTASSGPVTSATAAFAAVRARSPWFDGIAPKDPSAVGQSAWWQATPGAGGSWSVAVSVGWGDCPSGCIDNHVWAWQVTGDGSVSLASETGPAIPPDQRVALAASATASGVGGQVTAGPTCPVERPGDSACAPRPVKGAVLVVQDGSGKEVARFTTDASGLFRIGLAPGSYALVAQPAAGIMRTPTPQQLTVSVGKLTLVDLGYDTGIR